MIRFITTFSIAIVFCLSILSAQTDAWKFSGQVQIRTELDGRDFSNTTYPLSFTNMRTRFGVERILTENISAFIQVQDSRVWGETKNTILNAKNLDLHQGFVMFKNIFESPISIQAGRFELQYRNGRILSSNQFNYISRSWDGMRVSYDTKPFSIDAFALTHNNSMNYVGSAIPDTSQYPFPSKAETGYNVWGLWSKLAFDKEHYLDIFGYYDWNRNKTSKGNYTSDRFLAGLYYKVSIEDFYAILEGAYQGGTAGDQKTGNDPKKVQAFSTALGLNYSLEDFTFGLNADMMSGTSTEELAKGEVNNTYDATYQGKHTFYGGMDYFSNVTKGTGSRGLNDFYLRCDYAPKSSSFSVKMDIHQFMTNQPYLLQDGTDESMLGQEIDLILKYTILKGSTLEWGGSIFLPGDAMKDIYDVNKSVPFGTYDRTDPAFWTYVMLRMAL